MYAAQHQFQTSLQDLPKLWETLEIYLDEGIQCLKQWVNEQPLPLLCLVESKKIIIKTLENQILNEIQTSYPSFHFTYCPHLISFLIHDGPTLKLWGLYSQKPEWICTNVPDFTYIYIRNSWAVMLTFRGPIYWLDLSTRKMTKTSKSFQVSNSAAIHPTLPFCICEDDNHGISLYNMETGNEIFSKKSVHSNQITRLQWNQNGTILFSSSLDHRILIWNYHSATQELILKQELFMFSFWTRSLVVLPQQNFLAINEDGTIQHYHYDLSQNKWKFNQAYSNCDFYIPKIKIIPPNNLLIFYRNEWIYCSNDLKYVFQRGKTQESIHLVCFI